MICFYLFVVDRMSINNYQDEFHYLEIRMSKGTKTIRFSNLCFGYTPQRYNRSPTLLLLFYIRAIIGEYCCCNVYIQEYTINSTN